MIEPGHVYAGYYTTEVSKALEHTFAAGDTGSGKTVSFGCFGGIHGVNQVDRAPLHTGAVIKFFRKSVGNYMPGDVFKARCIAQFTITPDVKKEYSAKSGGPTLLGDSCGLVYGVFGVCHQMCNRVLHAMNYRRRFFNDAAVVWPPSFDISRILYLNCGTLPTLAVWGRFIGLVDNVIKHHDVVRELSDELEEKVVRYSASTRKELRKAGDDLFLSSLQAQIDQGYTEANAREMVLQSTMDRAVSVQMRAQASPEPPKTVDLATDLVPLHKALLEKKKDLDIPLFEGKISKEGYVSNLNGLVREYLHDAERVVPESDYEPMFGIEPGADVPDVASVVEMPEIENYEEIGKRLRL